LTQPLRDLGMAPQWQNPPCQSCRKPAQYYCPDCEWRTGRFPPAFCRPCMGRKHHSGTIYEFHSVEEINLGQPGVRIITPIVRELLLVWLLCAGWQAAGDILDQYKRGRSICLCVDYAREMLAAADVGFFYALKDRLAHMCDSEDSFWRFLADTWVRSILTGTDSWLILVVNVKKALAFQAMLFLVISPIMALACGCITFVVLQVELVLIPSWKPFVMAERVVKRLCLLHSFNTGKLKYAHPQTYPRMRSTEHWADWLIYWVLRKFRSWTFAVGAARNVLWMLLVQGLAFSFILRAACISLNARGPILKTLEILGLGTRLEAQRQKFAAVTGASRRLSDQVMDNFILSPSLAALGKQLPEGPLSALWLVLRFVFLPQNVLIAMLGAVLVYFFVIQKTRFVADWDTGERERCLGGCDGRPMWINLEEKETMDDKTGDANFLNVSSNAR